MFKYIVLVIGLLAITMTTTKSNAAVRLTVENKYVFAKSKSEKNKKTYRKRYTKKYKKREYTSRKFKRRGNSYRRSAMSRTNIVRWKGNRMPSSVARKLQEVERKFGKITIISSCRPGATVKNTGIPSMHSYCRAVDFNPPRRSYSAVAKYLKRTWKGGVGTYSGNFNHIHIDDNRGSWHN